MSLRVVPRFTIAGSELVLYYSQHDHDRGLLLVAVYVELPAKARREVPLELSRPLHQRGRQRGAVVGHVGEQE